MNRVKNIVLYNLQGFKFAVLILSAIMVVLGFLSIFTVVTVGDGTQSIKDSYFNGFEITFSIFLFVGFIACFKSNFNHLNVCGVTRKEFFRGNVLSIMASAVGMLALFGLLAGSYELLGGNAQTLVETAYQTESIPVTILFSICLFILASMGGWLVALLSYRFGTPMIIALAVSPAVIFTIIPILIHELHWGSAIWAIIQFYFGLNGFMPVQASLNFLATSVVIAFCNWLLMRKLPVKM